MHIRKCTCKCTCACTCTCTCKYTYTYTWTKKWDGKLLYNIVGQARMLWSVCG